MPRKAENGKRRPIHVGTRIQAVGAEGSVATAVVPVFRGEYVERIALDVLNVTTTAETNVDQPPIFGTYGFVLPWDMRSQEINTALVDQSFDRAITASSGDYLGGEANPGGNVTYGLMNFGRLRRLFTRNVLGDPMPVGQDALNNADARFIDRFRTVIKRGFEVQTDGLLVFGSRMWRLDAQTDFGAAEVDNSLTTEGFAAAYFQPAVNSGIAQASKAREVYYEGDNYIEADSFKETARRQYVLVRPVIHRMPAVANY